VATLKNCIEEILNNGTTKPKEIKDILQRRYGKNTTLNSIYAIKSNLKDKTQGGNNNSNYDSNPNGSNSLNEMARTQPQEPQQQKQVITGQKFNVQGITAPIQIEGDEMSKAYSDDQLQQEEINNPTPTFPIKVHKLGNISGDIVQAMYNTKKMKSLTSNYEVKDSDVQDLNNDVTEMIQYRIGDSVNHSDGDIINVGLDFGLIFLKSMAHKIKNKKSREIVESLTQEAEVNVKEHLKQGVKVMQEMKKEKEQKSNLCQNCNKQEIQKNGLCQECYFSQKIQSAQEEHNN
tara:strand:+ start:874 stop:1743 length:870 start_codon:yes stop_codon:yes gene_type:complete